MPLIVKDKFLENNDWALGDLMTAREHIDIIIRDLQANGSTHVDYVLEKLQSAAAILDNFNRLCLRNRGDNDGQANEIECNQDQA